MLLKEVLSFGGLRGARVVAGTAGLGSTIKSVSVLEVAEEIVSTWTIESQLYITSFYAIRGDAGMQKLVIETLSGCGCCGLVLCHLSYVLKKIDPGIIELCDRLNFPLIEADSDTSFIDIMNPIYNRLSTGRGTEVRDDFVDLLVSEKSFSEVLKIMAYRIGYEISFLDIYFNYLYSNKSEIKREKEQAYLNEKLGWKSMDISRLHYRVMELDGGRSMIYYIKKANSLFGFLCIEYRLGDTTEHVLEIADRLNLPCALLFHKTRNFQDAMNDYQQIYFSDLLVWNFRSDDLAVSRGRELGYLLPGKHFIMTVNINDFPEEPKLHRDLEIYIHRWYYPNLEQIVKSYSPENILHFRSDVIILLIEKPDEPGALRVMSEKILALFKSSRKTTVSIGISSRFEEINEIPKAYNESFDTAILGRKLYGVNHIAAFQDLGLLLKIRNLRSHPGIPALCAQTLAPLEDHDREKGTELMATACALFQNNLDAKRTAETLHIHRNTLLYRRNQIEQIMGYNAFELPHSFGFLAALFIKGVL